MLTVLSGGRDDRVWGQTLARFARQQFSGQLALLDGERRYAVAFAGGDIVGAQSPLATDAAVRVARLANMISPTQTANIVREQIAWPQVDEYELIAQVAKLTFEQQIVLRRKTILQRAARTFSLDSPEIAIEDAITIETLVSDPIDARALIYQGARHHRSERQLVAELRTLGRAVATFRLRPDLDLAPFGFGDDERAVLDQLRTGATLSELETFADVRVARAVVYALACCDACEVDPTSLDDVSELPAPVRPRTHEEIEDLPAPVDPDRDRNDTIIDRSDHLDLVGVTVDDRYVLERKLGEGAMGAVYLAHGKKLNRLFAVKVLHRRLLGNVKLRRRFEREAELTSRLRHANVVSLVDVGTIDNLPYLAMEFAEGHSLADLLLDAPLATPRAIRLLRQICAGLHHAHSQGVIHRDLKPSNILIESTPDEDIPRILDFGIAILRDPDGDERLTTRGVILGSPLYMAPELALGGTIDHRLDLYALGVITYQLLCGHFPFTGDGVDIAIANIQQPVPPMRERAPGVTVDPVLEAITHKLLAKRPEDRFADAGEVRNLLDLVERDRPAAEAALGIAPSPPPPPPPPAVVTVVAPPPAPIVVTVTAPPPAKRGLLKTIGMWKVAKEPLPKPKPIPREGSGTALHHFETEQMQPVRHELNWPLIGVVAGVLIVLIAILATR